jgi:hypothetical protein
MERLVYGRCNHNIKQQKLEVGQMEVLLEI